MLLTTLTSVLFVQSAGKRQADVSNFEVWVAQNIHTLDVLAVAHSLQALQDELSAIGYVSDVVKVKRWKVAGKFPYDELPHFKGLAPT